jgi:hypothetical protein
MSAENIAPEIRESIEPVGLKRARLAATFAGLFMAVASTWQLADGLARQVPVTQPLLVASAEISHHAPTATAVLVASVELSDRARAFHAMLERHEVTRREVERQWALAAQRTAESRVH